MHRIGLAMLFALAAPATAQVAPVDASWPLVARARDGECRLTVTGEGRFFRIAAAGLGSGTPARYIVTNGDMLPIDWDVRADGAGRFARYYLPFRHDRNGESISGDVVRVAVSTPECDLVTAFVWRRAGVTIHP